MSIEMVHLQEDNKILSLHALLVPTVEVVCGLLQANLAAWAPRGLACMEKKGLG